jgi:hypothetical protein
MTRNLVLQAALSVFVLAGCAATPASSSGDSKADDSEGAASTAASPAKPSSLYKIEGSKDYAYIRMEDGKYGLWKAGSTCADFSTAPTSCLETGTYELNGDHTQITFKDAAGESSTIDYSVNTVGLGSTSSTSVQTTGAQESEKSDPNNSDDQKPIVTAMNLRNCIHALVAACNLMTSSPSNLPEPLPVLPITQPIGGKKTSQG